jgi:hypothetical protein
MENTAIFNTPHQLHNNLIIVIDWNFEWGNCEYYGDWDKLYPTILIYPKTFDVKKTYRSMRAIKKLMEKCKMNKNLYE